MQPSDPDPANPPLAVRLFVAVKSCERYAARRAAVRETWLAAPPPEVAGLFACGAEGEAGPPRLEGDVLVVPGPDDYGSVQRKTEALLRHAVGHVRFERLLLCDDDTYVALDRVLAALDRGELRDDYVGCVLEHPGTGRFTSGGGGTLFSPRAARRLAEVGVAGAPDDVVLAAILADAGMPARHDARFRGLGEAWPEPGNDLFTGHWLGPDRLRVVHAALRAAASPPA